MKGWFTLILGACGGSSGEQHTHTHTHTAGQNGGATTGTGGRNGRRLNWAAFHDGIFWNTYAGGMAWLRIDSETAAQVSGEFYANFWAGEFVAENCGEWSEASTGGSTTTGAVP